MAEEWFTYKDLAERLGVSAEAVRQKTIRYRWPRRMNNRGKAEVRVDLVEVRDQMEVSPPRKPKDESPSDARPTPAEPPSDATQALAALEAHIASLKEILVEAKALTERERERADEERAKADKLQVRLDELMSERVSDARRVADVEAAIGEMRAAMAERVTRPWWRRLAG